MTGSGVTRLAVVGAGVMGRGIAQLAAQAGLHVRLVDARPEAAEDAFAAIAASLDRRVGKGRLGRAEADAAVARIAACADLTDLGPVDLAIEAIVEDLDAKRTLIAALEDVLDENALIATNTSSFLVSAVARDARRPDRVLGLHFFNPAPAMRLVEVIAGAETDETALERGVAFIRKLGHEPVAVADVSGFLVNQLGRGYVLEAARLVEEGLADPGTVDAVMTALGFRMGPFALMDLTGLDVTYPASVAIHEGNGQEPRYAPPALLRRRYLAGRYGAKTGNGFAPGPLPAEPSPVPPGTEPPLLWAPCKETALTAALERRAGGKGLARADDGRALLCLSVAGESVLREAIARGLDPTRTVGIDPLTLSGTGPLAVTPSPAVPPAALGGLRVRIGPAHATRDADGGTPAQRIVLQLALIAGDLVARGVADEAGVDRAARLALGHPEGPLERARRLGPARLEAWRTSIHARTGEPRFRPSPWLTEVALLDDTTHDPETA